MNENVQSVQGDADGADKDQPVTLRLFKGFAVNRIEEMDKPQLPNDIIMRIISEAESGYGGSHWRQHQRKYWRVLYHMVRSK